jgi:hypothetical protein
MPNQHVECPLMTQSGHCIGKSSVEGERASSRSLHA